MGLRAALPVARDLDQVDGRSAALLATGLHGAVLRHAAPAENPGQNRQRRQQPPGRRIIWLPLQQSTGQQLLCRTHVSLVHLAPRTHWCIFYARLHPLLLNRRGGNKKKPLAHLVRGFFGCGALLGPSNPYLTQCCDTRS